MRTPLFNIAAMVWLGLTSGGVSADLGAIRSWGSYLSDISAPTVAASPYDLMVIDPTRDGAPSGRFTPAEVQQMQTKPDGSKRLLLAYLSIGEAEDYRGYWKKDWRPNDPPWLDIENPEWPGNYKVRFWQPDWQRLIYGTPESALDQILAAGFDGVYLDVLDAYEFYEPSRPTAADEMVTFVRHLSAYAKGKRQGFIIVAQNAEPLVDQSGYLAAIDAIAKEDLFFGQEEEGAPTPATDHAESLKQLRKARAADKVVLTVDYISKQNQRSQVIEAASMNGFIPHFALRSLDRLTLPNGTVAESITGSSRDSRRAFFYSATIPSGQWRTVSRVEWSRSRYLYDYEDEIRGISQSFEAESFRESTVALDVTYGFTDWLEAGLSIPTVSSHFSPDLQDHTGVFKGPLDATGLGNIRLLTRAGKGWNHGSDYLLFSGEWGLPTDTRREDLFGEDTDFLFDIDYQHFWNHLGFSLGTACEIFATESYHDAESTLSLRVGLLADLGEKTFATMTISGNEFGTVQVEASLEMLVSGNASLEVFGGVDVAGDDDSAYAGIALTVAF